MRWLDPMGGRLTILGLLGRVERDLANCGLRHDCRTPIEALYNRGIIIIKFSVQFERAAMD